MFTASPDGKDLHIVDDYGEMLWRLRALYGKAKEGDGRVVLVEGEAGVGKTRLVDEFVGRLREEGEDLHFLFGSYPPGGAATASGAFATALLSASCCLVPTLFMVFGISFAGFINVAALEPYREIFTAAAVVMLGIGFYKMVIKKQIECDCEPSLTSRLLAVFFWALFLLSLAALFYPYYEGWIWGE